MFDAPNVPNNSYRLAPDDATYPGGTMNNLFWFVQVKQRFICNIARFNSSPFIIIGIRLAYQHIYRRVTCKRLSAVL